MSFLSADFVKRDNDLSNIDEPSSALTLYHLSQILPFARIVAFADSVVEPVKRA